MKILFKLNINKKIIKIGLFVFTTLFYLTINSSFAIAQQFSLDLGSETGPLTGRILQLIALITVIALAPSLLVVLTSFTRIIVVLSLLRSAMGVQQTPPNTVLVGLALFLTAYVMAPTLETAYQDAIVPLINEEIEEPEAARRIGEPVHEFMLGQVREKSFRKKRFKSY